MTPDLNPLTSDGLEAIYRADIHPVLFDATPVGQEHPVLLLLGGQPGAGKSRAAGRLVAQHPGMAALTGDELRIFHPDYRTLVTTQPEQAGVALAQATRVWVRAALQDALEGRRSMLLEGTFGDPDLVLDTAAQFRRSGFEIRVVAVASPPVLSVVSAASRYLRDRKAGNPARFTSLTAHDRGYDGTTRLIENLDPATAVDRLTIISRNGNLLFDQQREDSDAAAVTNARTALQEGRHPQSWGMRSTVELLGELKQITHYAIDSNQLTPLTVDLLVAAHELALTDVIPNLSIEADSTQARLLQQSVTEQLVALRRAVAPDEEADADLEPRREIASGVDLY